MLKKYAAFALAVCGLMSILGVSTSQGAILGDLIANNDSITCEDKIFSKFGYMRTGQNPPASQINVNCIVDSMGHVGLRFQGGFLDLPPNGASDALIEFTVDVDPDSPMLINDVHLSFNGAISGPVGFVGITETFLPTDPNVVLNVFNQRPGGFHLTDWANLTVPVRSLRVQKDIILFAGENSAAQVSFVDQTFSQIIPEPTSASLLGLGLLALGLRRRG